MCRRNLQYFAGKLKCLRLYLLSSNVFERTVIAGLLLKIVRRSGSSKSKRSFVFFFLRHVLINPFGKLPCTNDQQAGRQWVQRSRMPYFLNTNQIANLPDYIERCPAQWFIDQNNFSLFKTVCALHAAIYAAQLT